MSLIKNIRRIGNLITLLFVIIAFFLYTHYEPDGHKITIVNWSGEELKDPKVYITSNGWESPSKILTIQKYGSTYLLADFPTFSGSNTQTIYYDDVLPIDGNAVLIYEDSAGEVCSIPAPNGYMSGGSSNQTISFVIR